MQEIQSRFPGVIFLPYDCHQISSVPCKTINNQYGELCTPNTVDIMNLTKKKQEIQKPIKTLLKLQKCGQKSWPSSVVGGTVG